MSECWNELGLESEFGAIYPPVINDFWFNLQLG
jgi:hypothetical protein